MRLSLMSLALAVCVAAAGCDRSADVDKVPVGEKVDVIRQDGGVVSGTLAERDQRAVKVDVGSTSRSVPRDQIAAVRVVDAAKPVPLPPIARFREFVLPEGTTLVVRLETAVGSETSRVEDPVEAILRDSVVVDGVDVLPAGSIVRGEVASVQPAGKVKGRASLALRFTSASVEGREGRSAIKARMDVLAPTTKREDAATIGIPAAAGGVIGAILGGKKGAAIGTAVGGGGGAAVVLMTPGDEIVLARGATLTLATTEATEVRVPIPRVK